MKQYFLVFILFFGLASVNAQQIFVTKGKIEFEKKINLHKAIEAESEGDDGDNSWILSIKKSVPQFKSTYFDLYFDGDKTLYKPGRDVTTVQRIPDWLMGPANDNTIYNDLSTQQTTAQKTVFESTFLIQDSVRKVEWRITPDVRTIAGFECRKAVGRIMDSVYVIAFYTDQIITPGGPESFCGLPGMILGVAIPRINTTWFATKLELVEIKPTDMTIPKKGKKVNNSQLMAQLKTSLKDWGKYGQKNIWQTML
jgi:GLPGLI family protein